MPHSIPETLSVEAASAQIAQLINETPQTPSVSAIAAIIAKAAGGGLVLTISGVAQEIARLYHLRDALEAGEFDQNKLPAGQPSKPFVFFEEHKTAADIRRDTLEMVLLQLEPGSVDEVLSLLLMAAHTFEGFAGDAYTEERTPGLSVRAEREWQILTHAFEAMVRWLVHQGGATSPLIGAGYFRDGWLAPPAEQIATALARARELAEQADAGKAEPEDAA